MASSSKDLLGDLNKQHRAGLMLFAWHYFNLAKATDAQITSLNDQSVGLKVFLKRKETKDVVYHFSSEECKKASEGPARVVVALKSQQTANIPPFAVGILLFWVFSLVAAVPADKLVGPLTLLKPYVAKLLTESAALTVVKIMATLHFLETLYIQYLIAPVITSIPAKISWLVVSLVFGYPVTVRAMLLSKFAADAKKK